LSVQEVLGLKDFNEAVYKASTALSGGQGNTGDGQCGALSGGSMAISLIHGRDFSGQEDPEAYMNRQWKSWALARKLHDKFMEDYGTIICKEIQTKLMGRHFNTWDKKEIETLITSGMSKCPEVVGKAVKWTVEIILDEEEKPSGDWIPS
jgi:C_GCAxxG_C_C family probable redox protein